MQVKLTKVFRSNTDKNGNPLINRNGKPYVKCAIKTEDHGDSWLSGFEGELTSSWRDGDTVEIEVTQNGNYLNFEPIASKPSQSGAQSVAVIMAELSVLKTEMQMVRGQFENFIDYMRKNQIAFGSTKQAAYPNPTPVEHDAMQNNNHFAGGMGQNTDDTGKQLDEPF